MNAPLNLTLCRRAQLFLAQAPPWHRRLLRWTCRGSIAKRAYVALVQPEDIVFDVGAHRGTVTLLLSDLVGPQGEVHAFEPLPPSFARLRETLAHQQHFDNILLNNVACAEHACEITLNLPPQGPAQAEPRSHRPLPLRETNNVAPLPVQAIRLDDYSRGQAGHHLEFVNCDVDGAELLILRGMMRKLARFRPLVFTQVCAVLTEPFGYEPATLIAFLESVGYDTFYLVTNRLVPTCDPQAALAAAAAHQPAQILCAHSEEHGERMHHLDHRL